MSLSNLEAHEKKISSQNGEDGVIEAIFAEIGVTNKYFVEFGCEEAIECNVAQLAAQGWTGLLMDGFHKSKNPLVEIKNEFITADNIQLLFQKYGVPEHFDLLSIDIDGNDFWVWKQITHRPRVVIMEYNASIPPHLSRTILYNPRFLWSGTDYFGASLLALQKLGQSKGYTLVHCERAGANSFFIANEDLPSGFVPRSIEAIYRPPNYFYQGKRFRRDLVNHMIDPFQTVETSLQNYLYFQSDTG